jgi:hypothetical protein
MDFRELGLKDVDWIYLDWTLYSHRN